MNEYLAKLGFPTELYKCYDLLSTDDWALEMIPRPVIAVLMLFCIKPAVRSECGASVRSASLSRLCVRGVRLG